MKAKISVLFLVLAVLLVVGVLKKDLFTGKPAEDISNQEVLKEFSKQEAFDFLKTSSFVSYLGEPLNLDRVSIENADIITIHFWASWCAPCVNEVPELIDFAKRVSQKSSKGLKTVFIAVSLDEALEDLAKFLKSFPEFNKDPFVRVWDKSKDFSKLVNADRLPMTVILNKNISEPRIVRGVVEWKSINF